MRILMVIFVFLITGCSTMELSLTPAFREKPISMSDTANFHELKIKKKSVTLNITGKVLSENKEYNMWGYQFETLFIKNWNSMTIKAFEDSQIFSGIKIKSNQNAKEEIDTDYAIDVNFKINDHGNNEIWDYLGCLTLFLIPVKYHTDVSVTYTIQDKTKLKIREYTINETFTSWMHLLSFLWMPFCKSDKTISKEIYYDLNRQLIEQSYNDGFFK